MDTDILDEEETQIDDDVVIHYGVKGMKWGVRRDRPTSSFKAKKNTQRGKDMSPEARRQRIARNMALIRIGAGLSLALASTWLSTGDNLAKTMDFITKFEVNRLKGKMDFSAPDAKTIEKGLEFAQRNWRGVSNITTLK